MKLTYILAVAGGGAVGAVLRYLISLLPFKGDFPFATLVVNIVGALAIGIIAGLAEKKNVSEPLLLFVKTGVCGGFTTFSTFSLESVTLFRDGKTALAAVYVALSLIGCFIGVWAGNMIVDS